MAFSAQAVANEFIDIAGKGHLDPMKLQKLVYYAHGWHLALEGTALTKQSFEAWQFGPVIPDLYREFKIYGAGKVTAFATTFSDVTQRYIAPRLPECDVDEAAESAHSIIRDVWSIYGDYSAIKLSNDTHKDGTPWAKWYDPNRQHVIIPDADIKAYFRSLPRVESRGSIGARAHT